MNRVEVNTLSGKVAIEFETEPLRVALAEAMFREYRHQDEEGYSVAAGLFQHIWCCLLFGGEDEYHDFREKMPFNEIIKNWLE